jgi:RND superfamily putative drug exporter
VAVDATIVRMILVPSTMALVGDPNWWLPSWLDRILPHLDLEGDPAPDPAVELDPAVTAPADGAAR